MTLLFNDVKGSFVLLAQLVARREELERLCTVVVQPGVRLVTAVGPGGFAKTRLVLARAARPWDATDGIRLRLSMAI